MKVAIFGGSVGRRLLDEAQVKPKPVVEIGSRPIPWHTMRHSAHHGFNDFVIALCYEWECIKSYFVDFCSA